MTASSRKPGTWCYSEAVSALPATHARGTILLLKCLRLQGHLLFLARSISRIASRSYSSHLWRRRGCGRAADTGSSSRSP